MQAVSRILVFSLLTGVLLSGQLAASARAATCPLPNPPCSPRCEKTNGGTRAGAPAYHDGDPIGNGSYVSNIFYPTVTVTADPQRPNIRRITINAGSYQLQSVWHCQRVCAVGCTGIVIDYEWERYYYLTPPVTHYFIEYIYEPGVRLVEFLRNSAGALVKLVYEVDVSQHSKSLKYRYGPIPVRVFPGNEQQIVPQTEKVISLNTNPSAKKGVAKAHQKASTQSLPSTGKQGCRAPACAGDPVDLFSGAFIINNIDLEVPGILPPQVARTYHSAFADKDGPFGKGTGMVPYNARIDVARNADGTLLVAPGTQLLFSHGDHTGSQAGRCGWEFDLYRPGPNGLCRTTAHRRS